MHRRIDAHRLLVGALVGDLVIDIEEIAVAFLHGGFAELEDLFLRGVVEVGAVGDLLAVALDGFGEVEVNAEAGVTDEMLKNGKPAVIFGGAFVLTLIASFVFALFLGPKPAVGFAVGAGAAAGVCWVAAAFGINYLFERRSLKLFLINGGYNALLFTVIGLILGLWH